MSDVYAGVVAAGAKKAAKPPQQIFILGIISGTHIAFCSCLAVLIAYSIPELKHDNPGLQRLILGLVFPWGLVATVLTGAELFTSNTAFVAAAVMAGRTKPLGWLKSCGISYLGNLVGSLIIASLFHAAGVLHEGVPLAAIAKVSATWGQTFAKGILANWLVCIAVMMASAASDFTAKTIVIWPPIAAFVAMGLEHSIANMTIIPIGMFAGANITVTQFLVNNLIPVTLGNAIGGVVFVAGAYHIAWNSDAVDLSSLPIKQKPKKAPVPLNGVYIETAQISPQERGADRLNGSKPRHIALDNGPLVEIDDHHDHEHSDEEHPLTNFASKNMQQVQVSRQTTI